MSSNNAVQQSFADRLSTVLRRYEHEGCGTKASLAAKIDEEARDLTRWGNGTTMPAHTLVVLLGELPRHLADELIRPCGLKLVSRDAPADANVLSAAAAAADFASDVATRLADGEYCHRDEEATRQKAQRTITELAKLGDAL